MAPILFGLVGHLIVSNSLVCDDKKAVRKSFKLAIVSSGLWTMLIITYLVLASDADSTIYGNSTYSIQVYSMPSYIEAINRDMPPYVPPKLTEQNFIPAKIKQGMGYILNASNEQINNQMISGADNSSTGLDGVQTALSGYLVNIYIMHEEFDQYRSWADKIVVSKGIDYDLRVGCDDCRDIYDKNSVPRIIDYDSNLYYFEYDGEVFGMLFMDEKDIGKKSSDYVNITPFNAGLVP